MPLKICTPPALTPRTLPQVVVATGASAAQARPVPAIAAAAPASEVRSTVRRFGMVVSSKAGFRDIGPMKRQMHLNLFIQSRGHHEASWRHPDASPLPLTDIRFYEEMAQRAENGLFDSIFLADQLALDGDVGRAGRTWLEPITVLAALARA